MDEDERDLLSRMTDQADAALEVSEYLDEIHPAIAEAVDKGELLNIWTPDSNSMASGYAEHLTNLKIPLWGRQPNLLLHELGSFQDDRLLSNRLRNIFRPGHNTFLVNGSGSGKTRLLFEGLCQHWGFYFTSVVDSSYFAPCDIQNIIASRIPESPGFTENLPSASSSKDHHPACQTNRNIAARNIRHTLLSRLLIFNLFLELLKQKGVHSNEHRPFKRLWLLLQLMPKALRLSDPNIFDNLSDIVAPLNDQYLELEIEKAFVKMRRLCSHSANPNTPHAPFFLVLDEAQHAAKKLTGAFRSYMELDDSSRSILQEILRVWEQHSLGHGVFITVAGVGIPNESADQCVVPTPQRHANYRWSSDTGYFNQPPAHASYILKYLPPVYATSYSGRRLVERMCYWLQGRHRFTASFLVELIKDGISRPHGHLNVYVKHFANFTPSDSLALVQQETGKEVMVPNLHVGLGFNALTENKQMLAMMQDIVNGGLFGSTTSPPIWEHASRYVESGFALFAESEVGPAIVWEPLIFLSSTNWIDANRQSIEEYLTLRPDLLIQSVVYHLLKLITPERRLRDIFSFGKVIPAWASMGGTVLALHSDNVNLLRDPVRFSDHTIPSATLGKTARSIEETSAWLEHRDHIPFCFPHMSMGPSLLFIIGLSDGTLLWVALRVQDSYDTSKTPTLAAASMLRAVTPSFYFENEDDSISAGSSLLNETRARLLALPRRRSDAGRYSLLRVVVAPTLSNMSHCLNNDPDTDGHPLAWLSTPPGRHTF